MTCHCNKIKKNLERVLKNKQGENVGIMQITHSSTVNASA